MAKPQYNVGTGNRFDFLEDDSSKASNGEWQEKRRPAAPTAAAAAVAAAGPAQSPSNAAGDMESSALEAAASRSCSDAAARQSLWREWTKAASEGSAGRGRRADQTGSFKQVLLSSQALEASIESCIDPPLSAAHEADLKALLSAVAPGLASEATSFASLVVKLAQVMQHESPLVVSNAKRTLHAAVTALKSVGSSRAVAAPSENIMPQLQHLQQEEAKLEARLRHQSITGNDSAAALAERARCTGDLLKVHEQKLGLLTGGAVGKSGEVDVQMAAMQQLRTMMNKVSERLASAQNLHQALSGETKHLGAQRDRALAVLQRAEGQLNDEASSVERQIKEVEMHLALLKSALTDIAAKRNDIIGQREALLHAYANANRAGQPRETNTDNVSRMQQQLSTFQALDGLLVKLQQAAVANQTKSLAGSGNAAHSAPAEYLAVLDQHLGYKLAQQATVKQRVTFVAEKMTALEKDRQELLNMGMSDQAGNLNRPSEQLNKMMKDAMAAAKAIADGAEDASRTLHTSAVVLGFGNNQSLHPLFVRVEHQLAQLRSEHSSLVALSAGPVNAGSAQAPAALETLRQPYTPPHPGPGPTPTPSPASSFDAIRLATLAPGRGATPTLAGVQNALNQLSGTGQRTDSQDYANGGMSASARRNASKNNKQGGRGTKLMPQSGHVDGMRMMEAPMHFMESDMRAKDASEMHRLPGHIDVAAHVGTQPIAQHLDKAKSPASPPLSPTRPALQPSAIAASAPMPAVAAPGPKTAPAPPPQKVARGWAVVERPPAVSLRQPQEEDFGLPTPAEAAAGNNGVDAHKRGGAARKPNNKKPIKGTDGDAEMVPDSSDSEFSLFSYSPSNKPQTEAGPLGHQLSAPTTPAASAT
eukprot:jgi/Chlat1/4240/Chrsp27S04314